MFPQLTFTCSRSTIEVLEKGATDVVVVLLLLTLSLFHNPVSFVGFEQANFRWIIITCFHTLLL